MKFSIGGKNDGTGYGSVGPGYKNPLPKDTPSWSGSWDWKGAGGGIDWNKPKFSVADSDEEEWGSRFSKLFDKAKQTDKYRSMGDRPFGGEWSRGLGGNILENFGVYEPQKMSPLVIPGQEGKRGIGGTIGGLVGTAASFIPGIGPGIAAALPAIGGGVGSFFG
jgi:hypothetical protein